MLFWEFRRLEQVLMRLWDMLSCLVEVPRASGEFWVAKRIVSCWWKLQNFCCWCCRFLTFAFAMHVPHSRRRLWSWPSHSRRWFYDLEGVWSLVITFASLLSRFHRGRGIAGSPMLFFYAFATYWVCCASHLREGYHVLIEGILLYEAVCFTNARVIPRSRWKNAWAVRLYFENEGLSPIS